MFGWLVTAPLAAARWLLAPVPLTLLALGVGYLYLRLTKNYGFWRSRGVPGPPPKLPWGSELGLPFWTSIEDSENLLYYKYGGKKYCGFIELTRPVFYTGDPDLIRAITIKDFESFTNRRDQAADDDFKEMLSVVNGQKWKDTRAVMSPTFSASKLKAMHQMTLDNANNLSEYVLDEMRKHGEVEMKDSFGRFTMDNIASCAFGVNCDSFKDPSNKFTSKAASLFNPGFFAIVRFLALLTLPKVVSSMLPNPGKRTTEFFKGVVNKTIAYREEHTAVPRDFLQLVMETKDRDGNRVLSNDSIVAQSILFFIAGYDTTATLLTFAAYSLATSPELQRRAQQEVDDALRRHGGQMTYDAILDMPYLDRVLSETLRLYPPAMLLERESSKDYTVPGTDIHLPKGLLVRMPVFVLHRDPEHYPDPLRFDPDRFLPEEKERRHPCAYLPFGSGPRNCIAMRFALFEAKVALATVLRDMTLVPSEKTPPPPMPIEKKGFLLTPEGRKMHLKVAARLKDD